MCFNALSTKYTNIVVKNTIKSDRHFGYNKS